MGIRQTQYVGLSSTALTFLSEQPRTPVHRVSLEFRGDEPPKLTHSSYSEESYEKRVYGSTPGMFDEEVPLHDFILLDGRVFREILQAEPWSSGPMIFTTLREVHPDDHNIFLDEQDPLGFDWSDEEIRAEL